MANNKPIAAGKSSFDLIDFQKLLAALPIAGDSVILNAACDFGSYTLAMALFCPEGKVFAFDLWEEGIDRLRAATYDVEKKFLFLINFCYNNPEIR